MLKTVLSVKRIKNTLGIVNRTLATLVRPSEIFVTVSTSLPTAMGAQKQRIQKRARSPAIFRRIVSFANLPQNLRFAQHHRIKA